jgi:hypothetical protein
MSMGFYDRGSAGSLPPGGMAGRNTSGQHIARQEQGFVNSGGESCG